MLRVLSNESESQRILQKIKNVIKSTFFHEPMGVLYK